jgi:serine/threonine protein kinase
MVNSSHRGRGNIRRLLDSFEITGEHGKHLVLAFEAAQMSLRDMKLVFRQEGFDEDFVRGAITELLQALDFLHKHGEVVHTGTILSTLSSGWKSLTHLLQMCTLATCFWVLTIINCSRSLRK